MLFDPLDGLFSDEELHRAMRIVTSEAHADEFLNDVRYAREQQKRDYADYLANREEIDRRTKETGVGPAFGPLMISDDVFVVLSLMNDDLKARVGRYVALTQGEDESHARWWNRRCDQLRPWVQERLREMDGGE